MGRHTAAADGMFYTGPLELYAWTLWKLHE